MRHEKYRRSRRGGLQFAYAYMTRSHRLLRIAQGLIVVAFAAPVGCKRGRTGTSGGEISRNWTPAKPSGIDGVPAAQVAAAIAVELKGQPPAQLSADQWKHTQR